MKLNPNKCPVDKRNDFTNCVALNNKSFEYHKDLFFYYELLIGSYCDITVETVTNKEQMKEKINKWMQFDSYLERSLYYNGLVEEGLRDLAIPQYSVLDYICDFGIPNSRVIVECDGLTAHNNVKKFVSDRIRDRNLIKEGWIVLRYSTEEIHNNPRKCAIEIRKVADERKK